MAVRHGITPAGPVSKTREQQTRVATYKARLDGDGIERRAIAPAIRPLLQTHASSPGRTERHEEVMGRFTTVISGALLLSNGKRRS